jgi:hypothetical protein
MSQLTLISLSKLKITIYTDFLRFLFAGVGRTGHWIQGLVLTRQALYHFSHSVSPFLHLFFCGAVVWTQGLHLESLHQPFFLMGFFKIGSHKLFAQGWLQTMILLISVSWVARITGVSYQHPAALVIFEIGSCFAQACVDHHPSIYASLCSWDDRYVPPHPATSWDRVSCTFCPGWNS